MFPQISILSYVAFFPLPRPLSIMERGAGVRYPVRKYDEFLQFSKLNGFSGISLLKYLTSVRFIVWELNFS
jgi:hypothetical protein